MDDRRLTLIVVPHGDLDTKTFEISYRKLRFLAWTTLIGLCALVTMGGLWFYLLAQAARVPGLKEEIAKFEADKIRVDSLARMLTDVEAQYKRVRELLGADAVAAGQQPVLPELTDNAAKGGPEGPVVDAWPLGAVKGFITRGLTGEDNHPGLDIAVPQSTYVRAAGAGRVIEAGEHEIYGQYLRIDHGGDVETLYGHASQLLVAKGDRVNRQQVIALSGNSGRSTAPHLHFEVRVKGSPVDPQRYVKQP